MSGVVARPCYPWRQPKKPAEPLAGLTLAQLNAYLQAAQAAYHTLSIGGQVVQVVDQNGEQVRYTQATMANLYSYLQQLQAAIFALQQPQFCEPSGPIGFLF
jgi:hypothetical protein